MAILGRRGPLAQLVEQGTLNPKVVGSTPTRPTSLPWSASRSRPAEPGSAGRLAPLRTLLPSGPCDLTLSHSHTGPQRRARKPRCDPRSGPSRLAGTAGTRRARRSGRPPAGTRRKEVWALESGARTSCWCSLRSWRSARFCPRRYRRSGNEPGRRPAATAHRWPPPSADRHAHGTRPGRLRAATHPRPRGFVGAPRCRHEAHRW